MKAPKSYWTYQAGLIPEVHDLPEGAFNGDEAAWSRLSPGMRREVYRQAIKRAKQRLTNMKEENKK